MSRNRDMLRSVAIALADLGEPVVFVGGAVIELQVTDQAAPAPRPTEDVDVVVEVTTYAEYARLGERLRRRGFREDTREGAPTCRWTIGDVTVDVMPTPFDLPGFSSRWCTAALSVATVHDVGGGVSIRVPIAPALMAMKLEAFASGTRGDLDESRDIEDVIALVDGRATLAEEVLCAPLELRAYLQERVRGLLALAGFAETVAGHLPGDPASQGRVPLVLERLQRIAGR